MGAIAIGPGAIDRGSAVGLNGQTLIDANNPANATGKLTRVSVWAHASMPAGTKIGIFYVVSGNYFTCRSSATIDAVTAGSKQDFTVNLDVVAGDYIGIYCPSGSGSLEQDLSGAGYWVKNGDQTGCVNYNFGSPGTNKSDSLVGAGATPLTRGWNSK